MYVCYVCAGTSWCGVWVSVRVCYGGCVYGCVGVKKDVGDKVCCLICLLEILSVNKLEIVLLPRAHGW